MAQEPLWPDRGETGTLPSPPSPHLPPQKKKTNKKQTKKTTKKQEAHGPKFAHLSKTATAYIQSHATLPQQLGQKSDSALKRSMVILGSTLEQSW